MLQPILSKSSYLRGLQCKKSLWLYKHQFDLKDALTPQQEAIFSQGTKVGLLAQDLFPLGWDAGTKHYWEIEKGLVNTQLLIEQGASIIYEAAFMFDGLYAAMDILVKDEDGWKAYEVKSSTSISATHIQDAAIQYYILKNSGLDLTDISIVHINNQYVKKGDLDLEKLFKTNSVLDKIQDSLDEIPDQVLQFKKLLQHKTRPTMELGEQCFKPYDCDFKGCCWKHIPAYSVFDISRLRAPKKFDLYNQGVLTFDQIDLKTHSFNAAQTLQITSELSGKTHIDKPKIRKFIKELHYPLYYLDFETLAPAIPLYDDSRPYQQLVFQYSLHVQKEEGGDLTHHEYLAEADRAIDPRKGFVEQLIEECGENGDILVYNISFERGKLEDAVKQFPQYAGRLKNLISRLKDLMTPFQQQWYYTPAMKGSYSIKYVLPALVPELSYDDLEIKEGSTASLTFYQMLVKEYKGNKEKARNALLEYCKLDTLAMVRVLERLYQVI